MMARYITRVVVLETVDDAREYWLGIEADEELDLTEWEDLIPADGMTAAELSVVRRWITV